MGGNAVEQDLTPLLQKHLGALRSSPDYQRLLGAVARACAQGRSLPEQRLAHVANVVLRPIADDLSSCAPGNRLVIFHIAAINRQS